jgi:hypothetical protein
MKTKKLTFLLALTFLFLFGGNSFGIDFGKSEEGKYKGTNIGVHLCRKTNLDILKDSVLREDTTGNVVWLKQEAGFIANKCLRKHEKKADKIDWIDASRSTFFTDKIYDQSFNTYIKNNSKNKIITYIIISVKHEDNKNKPDVVGNSEPWVLPNHVFTETYHHGSSIKFFPKEDRLDKGLVKIKIDEVRYVDFVLKE